MPLDQLKEPVPLCMACMKVSAVVRVDMGWFSLKLCDTCFLRLRSAISKFDPEVDRPGKSKK